MRLKQLKILKKLNRAGKRVFSLLGAVAVFCLGFEAVPVSAETLSFEAVYSIYNANTLPKSTTDTTVNNWLGSHTNFNEVIIYQYKFSDGVNPDTIAVSYYMYDVNEFSATIDDDMFCLTNITSSTAKYIYTNFTVRYRDGKYEVYSGSSMPILSPSRKSGEKLTLSSIADALKVYSGCDILDNNGNIAVEKDVMPQSWQYDVTYSPVLSDDLSDLEYIDCTVSLKPEFIKFLDISSADYRLDFLPYISGSSASDDLARSYDYAYAVAPYRGTYYDMYTVESGSWGNHHVTGTYNKDKCLGTSIVYSLNASNNYTATVRISVPDTSLVSGNQYYFNVVGIMSSDLWYKTADETVPNRGIFRNLYDDYSSGNLSDWSDDGLQNFRVMDSTAFSMTSVLKKTSKNYNVDGGLMSNTTNALNSNPSIIKDVAGSGNDLAFSEVEDYNNQQAEDYVESAPSIEKSFSLAGLISTLNYSSEFLGFLSYGFSILPIQIWSLIKFSIVAMCFVAVFKKALEAFTNLN